MHPHPADSGLGTDVPANVLQRVVYCGVAQACKKEIDRRLDCRVQNADLSIVASASTSRLWLRAYLRMYFKVAKWQMQCNAAFLETGLARLTLLHQVLSHWWRLGESLALANCIRKARLENQI